MTDSVVAAPLRTPALLVLSDEEVALLRFTCDLFFVDESPLASFDKHPREPADYQGTYAALVERGIIDPAAFRITDDSLNRIAPVTECDARLVHLIVDDDGGVRQEDHWLLDEIAVVYERAGDKHIFGPDLDAEELISRLGRRLTARRSDGELFDAILTPAELVAVSLLLVAAGQVARRTLSLDEVKDALARVPAEETVLPAGAGASLFMAMKKEPAKKTSSVEPMLKALAEKRVLLNDALGLRLHPALFSLAGFHGRSRHTLVRTDFRDDDWLVREVTLLPIDGGLFVVAAARGGFRVAELDGLSLRQVLIDATGPQTPVEKRPKPMRLATLLQGMSRRI